MVKGGRVKMPGWASSHAESALAQGDSNSPLHGRRASPAKEPLDPGYCVHIRDTYAADLSILQANGACPGTCRLHPNTLKLAELPAELLGPCLQSSGGSRIHPVTCSMKRSTAGCRCCSTVWLGGARQPHHAAVSSCAAPAAKGRRLLRKPRQEF